MTETKQMALREAVNLCDDRRNAKKMIRFFSHGRRCLVFYGGDFGTSVWYV